MFRIRRQRFVFKRKKLITNVLVGTNNLDKSETFYTPLFELLGARILKRTERAIVWSFGDNYTGFAVSLPYDQNPASFGNGSMIGLSTNSIDQVQKVYKKAIELGGVCAGPPGERVPGVYAAYFRDHTKNKIGLFFKS